MTDWKKYDDVAVHAIVIQCFLFGQI